MANKHIEHKGSVSLVMREMQSCRHSAMALHTLWMAPVKRTNKYREDVEKLEASYNPGGNVTVLENSLAVP